MIEGMSLSGHLSNIDEIWVPRVTGQNVMDAGNEEKLLLVKW